MGRCGARRGEVAREVQKIMGNEGGDGFEGLAALLVPEFAGKEKRQVGRVSLLFSSFYILHVL